MASHPVRNTLLIVSGIILIVIILLIAFISPITKYLVEKYDEEYTGRQITMDWAYVNPFTGYIHFDDVKIYEQKSDSVFFAIGGLSAHLNMQKLFHKEYEIKDLSLSEPEIVVIQNTKDRFNFTDIVEKFSSEPEEDEKEKDTAAVHFNLLNVKISNGKIHYREKMTPVNYFIKNVDIESSGMRWNADTIANKVAFESGIGSGKVKGNFFMNTKSLDYKMDVIIQKLDLKIIEQYLKDMMNYGSFRAIGDANVKAAGNFNDGQNVNAKGMVAISDFHFGKSRNNDFVAFEKFIINVNKLNPRKKLYNIDSISIARPYFKYEQYDKLNNIETMFGQSGSNVQKTAGNAAQFNLVIELANYVKLLAKNFFRSDYKVNRLAIYGGNIKYNDYSISEKFSIAADPIYVLADSISTNKKSVTLKMNTGIKPYGNFNLALTINPKDSSDFTLNYNLEKLNATVLNPYIISATSFPLDRGTIEFKGNCNVQNGVIKSANHLLVIDPRVSMRLRNKDNSWLPLKLIMFFVRERGNAIDYEVPITGNLKDPNFHFRDVILDIITNVFVKPATTVYRSEVKTVENKIEKTLAFNWEMGSHTLVPDQEKFVKKVAEFLKDNPSAKIEAEPVQFQLKEKEYITFFEAKKKYFLAVNKKDRAAFTPEDSAAVAKMSAKDSLFVKYMKDHLKDKMMFSIQDKCRTFAGEAAIDKKYELLIKKREETFVNYFKENNLADRLKVVKSRNDIPFNGFSYYKISYNGKLPDELKEAFNKLNELDNEMPREKLKDERKKTRKFLDFLKKKK